METTNESGKPGPVATGVTAPSALRAFALALTMAVIPLFTLIDLLHGPRWAVWLLGVASVTFIGMQLRLVPAGIRRTSLVLALIAGTLLPFIDHPVKALERGIRLGGLIASLLLTVNLLSRAALRVPRVRVVVGGLYAVPDGQRYLALGVASQFFGGLLGLAGIAMMMEMAARQQQTSDADKISAFCAISRGYAALSLWSPMYSNMSIVLALYHGTTWVSVLPYALSISAALMVLGAVLDAVARRNSRACTQEPGRWRCWPLLRAALPVIVCMLGFVAFMVVTSVRLEIPIPAVIIAAAPLAGWFLNAFMVAHQRGRLQRGAHLLGTDFRSFGAMAGEVMLFLASACAGTVMASAIPPSWTAAVAQLIGTSALLGSLFLATSIVLLSATAVHPMLSAVLIASSFTPASLGLPVIVHLCAVLVGWGLAIIVTPFSVLSLMASRFSGIPLLVISLRANLAFVVFGLLMATVVLGSIARFAPP